MKRLSAAAAIVGIALWIAAPVAVFVVASQASSDLRLHEDRPVWVPAVQADTKVASRVGVRLNWEADGAVFAPAWDGIVQAVTTSPHLASNQVLATISGVQRVAYHSTVPFSRPLAAGDRGVEVAALNRLLELRGLPNSASDIFTSSTTRGVRMLGVQLGAGSTAVFDPAWVVYLPTEEVDIESNALEVGGVAPSPGSILLELADRLTSAQVVSFVEAPDGSDSSALEDAETTPVSEGWTLTVADAVIAVDVDSASVAAESLSDLASIAKDGAPVLPGVIARPAAAGEWQVPTAAVRTSSDGEHYVVHRPADGGDARRVVVVVSGEGGGVTTVRPETDLRGAVELRG